MCGIGWGWPATNQPPKQSWTGRSAFTSSSPLPGRAVAACLIALRGAPFRLSRELPKFFGTRKWLPYTSALGVRPGTLRSRTANAFECRQLPHRCIKKIHRHWDLQACLCGALWESAVHLLQQAVPASAAIPSFSEGSQFACRERIAEKQRRCLFTNCRFGAPGRPSLPPVAGGA